MGHPRDQRIDSDFHQFRTPLTVLNMSSMHTRSVLILALGTFRDPNDDLLNVLRQNSDSVRLFTLALALSSAGVASPNARLPHANAARNFHWLSTES